MDVLGTFIVIGAVHAVILAAYAAVATRRRSDHAWLATLFALLAVIVTAILLTHRVHGAPQRIAVAVEQAAAWLIGPAMFAYIRHATERPLSRRALAAHFAAPGLIIVLQTAPMVLGIWSPLPWPPVLYEAAYSVASAIVFARRSRPENRSARAYWWPLGALVLMFCVHAGQALRFIAPRVAVDVVPLAGALGASLALLILVMTQAARSGGQRYARSALGREELQRVHAAVMRALDGPPPLYQQMDLTLTDLSAAAGAPAHHVSQALSEIAGVSFYEVLTQRRIADARRRLLEPANANIAVDALGMEAGFRSRSAFYAAFKAATGMTPAEFRRGGGKSVSATAG